MAPSSLALPSTTSTSTPVSHAQNREHPASTHTQTPKQSMGRQSSIKQGPVRTLGLTSDPKAAGSPERRSSNAAPQTPTHGDGEPETSAGWRPPRAGPWGQGSADPEGLRTRGSRTTHPPRPRPPGPVAAPAPPPHPPQARSRGAPPPSRRPPRPPPPPPHPLRVTWGLRVWISWAGSASGETWRQGREAGGAVAPVGAGRRRGAGTYGQPGFLPGSLLLSRPGLLSSSALLQGLFSFTLICLHGK